MKACDRKIFWAMGNCSGKLSTVVDKAQVYACSGDDLILASEPFVLTHSVMLFYN